jgi:hypothetical protein
VFINNIPAAMKDSLMDDSAAIVSAVSSTVRINNRYAAVVTSVTTPHPADPGKGSPGTIVAGSPNVKIG